MGDFLGGMGIFAVIFGVVAGVLWLLLPFFVFSIKSQLETLVEEVRVGNSQRERIAAELERLKAKIEQDAER